VQTVDCWWTEVSNLYTCDPEGRYLRRLGFDQVTPYPPIWTTASDLHALGLQRPHPNVSPSPVPDVPDGTAQRVYGNNSVPDDILHAGIPGTGSWSPSWRATTRSDGKARLIDPASGGGKRRSAWPSPDPAVRVDAYGQAASVPVPLSSGNRVPRGSFPSSRSLRSAFTS
jgi:hypothetical protein